MSIGPGFSVRLPHLHVRCAAAWQRVVSGRAGRYTGIAAVVLSPLIATALVIARFGTAGTLAALGQAHLSVLLLVVAVGVVTQIVRAERARRMLTRRHALTFGESYGSMVIGHGIGDLIPLAPGGPALRCAVLERRAHVPVPFSAGAFVVEGVLDAVGLVFAAAGLLLVGWRLAPAGLLLPGAGVLALVVAVLVVTRLRIRPPRFTQRPAFRRVLHDLGGGLVVLRDAGRASLVTIFGLTLLATALSGLQVALYLFAFGLASSPRTVLLVVLLTLVGGILPVKFPGAGTLTATAVLAVAGLHGPGVSGYLLVSRALLSSQTTFLALLVLAWWSRPTVDLQAIAVRMQRYVLDAASTMVAAFRAWASTTT
jgi:hypothetical protein